LTIELLVLDVDGVLTDNSFLLRAEGGEQKAFYAPDGFGLKLLMRAGVRTAFLTGRNSPVVERRARELGVDLVVQGRDDKGAAFPEVCAQLGVDPARAGYVGDDLVDLAAMKRAGFSAAPADARPEVRARVEYVASARGGRGAVRDICEEILRRLGCWDAIVEEYAG
jgi:3-deoxy-D-manno-octulosonate 8-phosphate phosphatase (KDO 8-P phosphatase)